MSLCKSQILINTYEALSRNWKSTKRESSVNVTFGWFVFPANFNQLFQQRHSCWWRPIAAACLLSTPSFTITSTDYTAIPHPTARSQPVDVEIETPSSMTQHETQTSYSEFALPLFVNTPSLSPFVMVSPQRHRRLFKFWLGSQILAVRLWTLIRRRQVVMATANTGFGKTKPASPRRCC